MHSCNQLQSSRLFLVLGFTFQPHLQLALATCTYTSFGWCCGFYLESQLLRSGLLCPLISRSLDTIASLLVTLNDLYRNTNKRICICKLLSCACEPAGSLTFLYWRVWVTKAFACIQVADLPLHISAWIPTAAWQMHLPFTVYQGALHSTCPVSGAQAAPGVLQSPWTPPSGNPLLLDSSSCRRSW